MKRKPKGSCMMSIAHKHQFSWSVPGTIWLRTVEMTRVLGHSVLELFRYFLSLNLPFNYYCYLSCPKSYITLFFFFFWCGDRCEMPRKRRRKEEEWMNLLPEGKFLTPFSCIPLTVLSLKSCLEHFPPGPTQHLCCAPQFWCPNPLWKLIVLAGNFWTLLSSALKIMVNWTRGYWQSRRQVNIPEIS